MTTPFFSPMGCQSMVGRVLFESLSGDMSSKPQTVSI